MRLLRKLFIIENSSSSSLTTFDVNRLGYSTMYMSVATGKNISIYILVRLSLEYYVLLRRWEINVRASLEGDVQNILFPGFGIGNQN